MNATIGPPHSSGPDLIEQRRLEHARRAGWPQLDRADLDFQRYWVEYRPTGRFYSVHRGELVDGLYTSAAAFYLNDRGAIVFLERPPAGSPQTREELEQRQAARR
ncbi:MAG TPA: hypothetical protein VFL61_09685 [Gaiellaceae bacterium]|nr:hypothetical protein [Gaiellaceae bacterium]